MRHPLQMRGKGRLLCKGEAIAPKEMLGTLWAHRVTTFKAFQLLWFDWLFRGSEGENTESREPKRQLLFLPASTNDTRRQDCNLVVDDRSVCFILGLTELSLVPADTGCTSCT